EPPEPPATRAAQRRQHGHVRGRRPQDPLDARRAVRLDRRTRPRDEDGVHARHHAGRREAERHREGALRGRGGGPMRTLRVFESIAVDGYFTDAGGDLTWAHAGREDAEFAAWVGGNASSGGELLFGRKTYEMMAAFWPTPLAAQQMPVVAKGMNAA